MGTQQSCCSRSQNESASSTFSKPVQKILAELGSRGEKDQLEFKNKDRSNWAQKFPHLQVDSGNSSVIIKKRVFPHQTSFETLNVSQTTAAEGRPSVPERIDMLNVSHTASVRGSIKEAQNSNPNPEIKKFIIQNLSEEEFGVLHANIQMFMRRTLGEEEKFDRVREFAQDLTRFLCWLYRELGKKLEPALQGKESFATIVQWIVYDLLSGNGVFQKFELAQADDKKIFWESLEIDSNLYISQSLAEVCDAQALEKAHSKIWAIHTEKNPLKKLMRMGELNDLAEKILLQYSDSAKKKLNHSLIMLYWIVKSEINLKADIEWVESLCDPDPSKKIWEPFFYIKGWMALLKEEEKQAEIPRAGNVNERITIDPFDFSQSHIEIVDHSIIQQNHIESIYNHESIIREVGVQEYDMSIRYS